MIFPRYFWQIFRQTSLFLAACAILFGGLTIALAQQEDTRPDAIAVAQFEQGQDAHEHGETAAALKFYEKAIELQPDFPEAEYQRGTALQQLGREAEAEKAYRRAIELHEDWSLPMAKLGALLVKQGSFDEAEKILTKAVELDAANSPALVALTELEINSKAAPEKQQNLLGKIKANTDGKANAPVALWTARAALERNLGSSNAAKTSIARALQLAPEDFGARLTRGEIFLSENDYAAALDDAKFALHTAPENLQARLLLSRIYAAEGKSDESLKILDALNPEQKKLSVVAELRKTVSINGASDTGSIETLEKLLESDSKNIVLLSRLCNLTRTVNPQQSLDYCRRAAEIEPNNPAHAVGYGAALVQARQFGNAITVLRRILTVAPDNYTARANLATALYEAKRFQEAITEFNALLETKPDVPASYFFLATAYDTLGDFTEAMAAYQKFLELANPKQNQLEIDKVKLRLPGLTRQIEKGAGKKKPRT
ncbi:MAG: tetratricopeptide repeat protein [Pyrinomonadaceae bacterium]